jgi:NADPH2:quinone reductase
MRAAVISGNGAAPVLQDFPEPTAQEGAVLIEVDTAGLGGWDVLGAYRLGVQYPCVIRGEGVGRAEDGRRVYFGERSLSPWGAWAERTIVPSAEVWDVPDGIDDRTAITMGIAGTGILIPLEAAGIQPGESVLILGATGVLGQIGLQLAKGLGAGRVVAAARSQAGLDRLMERGLADAAVAMGGDNDTEALKIASGGEGFDVVLDLVFGKPFLSAVKATKWGARLITIGTGAGRVVDLNIGDLLFRTLTCIGTGQRPPADREAIWRRLLAMQKDQAITVDYLDYEFSDAPEAWAAQVSGPHAKITAKLR